MHRVSIAFFSGLLVSTSSVLAQSAIGSDQATTLGQGVAGLARPSQIPSALGPGPSSTGSADTPALPKAAWPIEGPISGSTPVQLGLFTLATGITTGSFYDDNVFATHAFRRSDVAFFARPDMTLSAQGSDYAMQGTAYLEGRKYVHYDSEDQVNGGIGFAGLYQPDATTQVRGHIQYARGHEERGTGDSAFAILDRPVAFDQIDGALSLNKTYDRWWTSVGASALGALYQNSTIDGFFVDQTYRNALIPALTVRQGYVVAPLTSVFLDWTGNVRQFRYEPLSSSGFRTVAGLLLEPGPGARVKGEVFGGYMIQSYKGPGLPGGPGLMGVATPTYGVSLAMLLTESATLAVDGRREAKESGLFGGVSLIESSAAVRVDYELIPNLVIGMGATLLIDEFLGAPRADRYVSPLASVKYTLSKTASVSLDYRLLDFRSSTVPAFDDSFRRNVVLGSLNVRF